MLESLKRLSDNRAIRIFILLALTSSFCIALTGFRVFYTETGLFLFLIWNLFLAWIPYFISRTLQPMENAGIPKFVLVGLLCIWMLFFPNAPYLVTDLFHLRARLEVPLWFDTMLIWSYAWTGVLVGYVSLLEVHRFLKFEWKLKRSWLIPIAALTLSALGIYIGRFLRWNSWDVFSRPFAFLEDVYIHMASIQTISIVIVLSTFLLLGYWTMMQFVQLEKETSV